MFTQQGSRFQASLGPSPTPGGPAHQRPICSQDPGKEGNRLGQDTALGAERSWGWRASRGPKGYSAKTSCQRPGTSCSEGGCRGTSWSGGAARPPRGSQDKGSARAGSDPLQASP